MTQKIKCDNCGHAGVAYLYHPFKKVRRKWQYPFIVEVTFKGESDSQFVATATVEEGRKSYPTDVGEDNVVTWKRFYGKTNARDTWEWLDREECKNCGELQ